MSFYLFAILSTAASELPPEPVPHLMPPNPVPTSDLPLQSQPLTWTRNNHSMNFSQSQEPIQQEGRALVWAAPAFPLVTSHQGRTSDCNPCDRVPWVPVARALHDTQYALSIPAIQLTLPVNYGIPVTQLRPPTQYKASPQGFSPQNYGPPGQHQKPFPPRLDLPSQNYNYPFESYGSSTLNNGFSSSQNRSPPSQKYVSFPAKPVEANNNHKSNSPPSSSFGPLEKEKSGIPPSPLPQNNLFPTYRPSQTQTQQTSATNTIPASTKNLAPTNYQNLPAVKFGPPFNANPHVNQNPLNYSPLQSNIRPLKQQYRDESDKRPFFIYNPIPFPAMSKTQLPPLLNYQPFKDGKQENPHSYLQPPKPQNVIFTITETEDSCKKCQEQKVLKDSEPAQAELVTENVVKTAELTNNKPIEQQNPGVQIVKSVPLAEYLSSVEYPMQIIQAPILDVPDLSKYFHLGYHNFPQLKNVQENTFGTAQINSQTFNHPLQQSMHYFNHDSTRPNSTTFEKAQTTTALDDVNVSSDQEPTSNTLPHNHKLSTIALQNNNSTAKEFTTGSLFSQTTPTYTIPTTKPSQIFHISKARPPLYSSNQANAAFQSSSTTGHYVTLKPMTSSPVLTTTSSTTLQEPLHSSTVNQQSTLTTRGQNPSGQASLRFQNIGAIRDWNYGRGWVNTPPHPFVVTTATTKSAQFSARPTPATSKKAKHIQQIIVPYTTNKQAAAALNEPDKWTPLPPTNQGRKVPPSFRIGDQFPSSTGFDQFHNYKNSFSPVNSPTGSNLPFSSPDSEPHSIFPTNNGQPLNLPPQVINHILHLNKQGSLWPSGPEGLQQLLVTNLQGLIRGEEDSIDITNLQKNINNWTAEGYKQNSPSVNFLPVTTIPHIFNSKKIPDEYLTSTVPTTANSSQKHFYRHSLDSDHDFAESQKLQIKVDPLGQEKDYEQSKDSFDNIKSLLNSWSLLDNKETTSSVEEITTLSTEPTVKTWENIQVSISPLTNEKVYVVTPVPATEESSTQLLNLQMKNSFSEASKDLNSGPTSRSD